MTTYDRAFDVVDRILADEITLPVFISHNDELYESLRYAIGYTSDDHSTVSDVAIIALSHIAHLATHAENKQRWASLLLSALSKTEHQEPETACGLYRHYGHLLHSQYKYRAAQSALASALDYAVSDTTKAQVLVEFFQMHEFIYMSEYDLVGYADQARELVERLDDKHLVAQLYTEICRVYALQGATDIVKVCANRALYYWDKVGNHEQKGRVYLTLVEVARFTYKTNDAYRNLEKAREQFEPTSHPDRDMVLAYWESAILRVEKRYSEAAELSMRVLSHYESLDNHTKYHIFIAANTHAICLAYYGMGEYQSALFWAQNHVASLAGQGNQYAEAVAYNLIGSIYLQMNNEHQARASLMDAIKLSRDLIDSPNVSHLHTCINININNLEKLK